MTVLRFRALSLPPASGFPELSEEIYERLLYHPGRGFQRGVVHVLGVHEIRYRFRHFRVFEVRLQFGCIGKLPFVALQRGVEPVDPRSVFRLRRKNGGKHHVDPVDGRRDPVPIVLQKVLAERNDRAEHV